MEHVREKVKLSGQGNEVELEAVSISYGITPVQIVERNINGDAIVLKLRNKKRIAIDDWFDPDTYFRLLEVISVPVVGVTYYVMPEGSTGFEIKDSFNAYVVSFTFSRIVLQYEISLELEEL